jgi:hypothetical protein
MAKAARGELTNGRQVEILRSENGLLNLVHNWDNRSIVSAATISKMKHSQRDLITENMKPIHDVLSKAKHLSTVKGQMRGYFESAASEPVRSHWATCCEPRSHKPKTHFAPRAHFSFI